MAATATATATVTAVQVLSRSSNANSNASLSGSTHAGTHTGRSTSIGRDGGDVDRGLILKPRSSFEQRTSDRLKEMDLALCTLRFADLPLYGRDTQLDTLQRLAKSLTKQTFTRGLLTINGLSGSGKTALAVNLETMATGLSLGLFPAYKCELGNTNEDPFACIEHVIDALCQQILQLPLRQGQPLLHSTGTSTASTISISSTGTGTGSSSTSNSGTGTCNKVFLQDITDTLAKELDKTEKEALMAAIPAFADILSIATVTATATASSEQPQEPQASNKDATSYKEEASKMHYVFRHFIRIVATHCPITILIDDCQWADAASFQWIKALLTETTDTCNDVDVGTVLVVLCYRTNEVNQQHELSKMLCDLKQNDSDINNNSDNQAFLLEELAVGNLTVQDVNSLLSALISCSDLNETLELAKIVHEKTLGNAFFVVQFIMRLRDDQHLSFSLGLMKWVWSDANEIKTNYQSTDNVGDLMKGKLQDNATALSVLPVAACLGSMFPTAAVVDVIERLREHQQMTDQDEDANDTLDAATSIRECCEEGFLEPVPGSPDNTRFVHDQIQQAALLFANQELKIAIGNVLLDLYAGRQEELGYMIHAALPLVNLQTTAPSDPKRLQIIQMNASAGRRALECSAFEQAVLHLKTAVSLLIDSHWAKNEELSAEIFTMAAAADFCTGDLERVQTHADQVLGRPYVPLLDKVDICHTMMDVYESTFNSNKGVLLGSKILKDLGRRFPKRKLGITTKTLSGLLNAKLQLKKKLSKEALSKKPITTDRKTLATMRMLDKFASAVYHAKPELLPLVLLESTKCSETLGLNAYSAAAYPFVGLIFAGVFEDFETAKVCGEAGVMIMRRCDFPRINSRCIMLAYGLCIHWSTPLKDCLNTLREGYETGMKTGTLTADGAFGAIHFYLSFCFWSGLDLKTLHADYSTYIRQMDECGAAKAALMTKPNRHIITRLRGLPDEMNEEEVVSFSREKKDPVVECFLRWAQIWLACYLGHHREAAELSLEWIPKIVKLLAAHNIVLESIFVSALSSMAVIRETGGNKKLRKHATFCRKKMKSWVSKGNPNCVAHESLLEAEHRAMQKDRALAVRSFEVAVLLAGRRGLTHLQALSNERFAIYLNEVGELEDAKYRFGQAQFLYSDWGATVKANEMRVMKESME
ncbi:Transcriptional regulator [Seminavis robusta]|uniref:Transcriptional regulator n=1 Tax=Seminavis robusta TaxID=568900 RepID=A0A9N8HBH9_9STRA|nr:Transcriptional regulator [Seminavis robusta]|eukprot:Sro183_g079760.1 Transcriptional regulator (1162) ;mRNA; f:86430-90244